MRVRQSLLLRETGWPRVAWDALLAGIAILTIVFLPLDLLKAQYNGTSLSSIWLFFDGIGLLDVALNLLTSYELNGVILRDRRSISRSYWHGMAPVDLASNLPSLLSTLLPFSKPAIHLFSLLRVVRLHFILSRWEKLSLFDIRWLRLIRYSLAAFIITHWMACLWLWVGLRDGPSGGWIQKAGWMGEGFDFLYEKSLFWTVTLVTVGYGEIFPQTILETRVAMLLMASSLLIYTFLIANMLTFLGKLDGGRTEFIRRQDLLTKALRYNGVSSSMIERVRRFNDYQWSQTNGMDVQQILSEFTPELRIEVMLEIMKSAVTNISFLNKAPLALKNACSLSCSPSPILLVLWYTKVLSKAIKFSSSPKEVCALMLRKLYRRPFFG